MVAALAAFGCNSRPKEYVIGAAGPQTLPIGVANQRGIDLAVEEINKAGGIDGVPLRVITRDDQANGAEATKIAAAFVDDVQVSGVVGHLNSAAMVSAAQVYHTGELVAIATSASSPDLSHISPWVFRMNTSDSTNGTVLADFANSLEKKLGRTPRVGLLYQNDAYGRGLASAFERTFRGTLVNSDPISSTTAMEPYVAYFKQQKVDLIFIASDETAGHPFLTEARKQQLGGIFLAGDGWQPITDDPASEGVYIGVPFTAQASDSVTQRFVDAYRAKYGQVPNALAALAYDATKILAQAIGAVHGDRAKVREYLSALRDTNAYHGVSGKTWFNRDNDPAGNHFVITRVTHRHMIPVSEPDVRP
jgi:branched-chain amino acid transport system substrate-binding protein